MISENTAAASSSRLAGSLSAASSGENASVVATVVAIINFTLHLPFAMTIDNLFSNLTPGEMMGLCCSRHAVVFVCG
jgi:hypothetical protein